MRDQDYFDWTGRVQNWGKVNYVLFACSLTTRKWNCLSYPLLPLFADASSLITEGLQLDFGRECEILPLPGLTL